MQTCRSKIIPLRGLASAWADMPSATNEHLCSRDTDRQVGDLGLVVHEPNLRMWIGGMLVEAKDVVTMGIVMLHHSLFDPVNVENI